MRKMKLTSVCALWFNSRGVAFGDGGAGGVADEVPIFFANESRGASHEPPMPPTSGSRGRKPCWRQSGRPAAGSAGRDAGMGRRYSGGISAHPTARREKLEPSQVEIERAFDVRRRANAWSEREGRAQGGLDHARVDPRATPNAAPEPATSRACSTLRMVPIPASIPGTRSTIARNAPMAAGVRNVSSIAVTPPESNASATGTPSSTRSITNTATTPDAAQPLENLVLLVTPTCITKPLPGKKEKPAEKSSRPFHSHILTIDQPEGLRRKAIDRENHFSERRIAMFLKTLRDIARPQVVAIFDAIKRSEGLSVAEIARELKMSYMGIKQHCLDLEKKGYLDTWRRPKEVGRPELAYRLTLKGAGALSTVEQRTEHRTARIGEAALRGDRGREDLVYRI